ncbi:MAG: hypothetical protein ACI4UH_01180 [Dorea sp.]
MNETAFRLKELCEIIFSVTGLDVELLHHDFEQIVFFTHNRVPESVTECFKEYYRETYACLGNKKETACYLHECEKLSLLFLDIHVYVPDGHDFYVCIGPVLTEVCDENLVSKVMKRFRHF